jgi:hypothetical protein
VTVLQIAFPQAWATLPTGAAGERTAQELVAGLAELGPEVQRTTGAFLEALVPTLADLGIGTFASLALPDGEGGLLQAYCTVMIIGAGTVADLTAAAESGPHPGLERTTTTVQLPLGPAVRSSAVRLVGELADEDGTAPFSAEVRFALPLPDGRVGVLHFETLALAYLAEMEELFDAIAATAQLG